MVFSIFRECKGPILSQQKITRRNITKHCLFSYHIICTILTENVIIQYSLIYLKTITLLCFVSIELKSKSVLKCILMGCFLLTLLSKFQSIIKKSMRSWVRVISKLILIKFRIMVSCCCEIFLNVSAFLRVLGQLIKNWVRQYKRESVPSQ